MNMINIPAAQMKYSLDANTRLIEKIASALKKYFSENSEIILAGLASMNGNVSYHYYSAIKYK